LGAFHYGVHQDRNRHLWSAEVTDQSNPAVMTGESGDCGRKLTVAEQFWDDEVVIWKSNQSFKKSDPWGDVSEEASPFRFVRAFTRSTP